MMRSFKLLARLKSCALDHRPLRLTAERSEREWLKIYEGILDEVLEN